MGFFSFAVYSAHSRIGRRNLGIILRHSSAIKTPSLPTFSRIDGSGTPRFDSLLERGNGNIKYLPRVGMESLITLTVAPLYPCATTGFTGLPYLSNKTKNYKKNPLHYRLQKTITSFQTALQQNIDDFINLNKGI